MLRGPGGSGNLRVLSVVSGRQVAQCPRVVREGLAQWHLRSDRNCQETPGFLQLTCAAEEDRTLSLVPSPGGRGGTVPRRVTPRVVPLWEILWAATLGMLGCAFQVAPLS